MIIGSIWPEKIALPILTISLCLRFSLSSESKKKMVVGMAPIRVPTISASSPLGNDGFCKKLILNYVLVLFFIGGNINPLT